MPRLSVKINSAMRSVSLSILGSVLCVTFFFALRQMQVRGFASPQSKFDNLLSVSFNHEMNARAASAGPPASRQALERNQARPLSLVAGDFDEDGVADLIGGYAGGNRGIVSLSRGNVDAIYPNTTAAKSAARSFFRPNATVFELPLAPDLMGAGDFNADGHLDLVAASRGGRELYLLFGDGHGGLNEARTVELPGNVTALMTGEMNRADGLAEIIVGIAGSTGSQVLIFESPEGALRGDHEVLTLSDEITALAIDRVDSDYLFDLVIAGGRELTIVHGRDRRLSSTQMQREKVSPAKISHYSTPAKIKSLTVGHFTDGVRTQVATLGDDGAVRVISANSVDDWRSETLGTRSWPQSTGLFGARISGGRFDDLVVMDAGNRQLAVLVADGESAAKSSSMALSSSARLAASIDIDNAPVAAVPMRLQADARSALVILKQGQSAPQIVAPQIAATFVVNSAADLPDAVPGDGLCNTSAATAQGVCTLRAAIQEANASAGADVITFNIGEGGVATINLNSPLPNITAPLTIDGTTQPGFTSSPIIELNGANARAGGLIITGGSSTVRGLVINRFLGSAIQLIGSGGNIVEGNFLGTNVGGTDILGNSGNGVFVSDSSNNLIGGGNPAARNLISGNRIPGVFIGPEIPTRGEIRQSLAQSKVNASGASDLRPNPSPVSISAVSTGNIVQGNYIGTDITGTKSMGNADSGGVAIIAASNNIIGGTTANARNLLSGNEGNGAVISISGNINGIPVEGEASGNLVQGNYIGTNAVGSARLPNKGEGVYVFVATNNTIGGTLAAARNLISGNFNDGVRLQGAPENLVQGNLIGTDVTGTINLGNSLAGVFITGVSEQPSLSAFSAFSAAPIVGGTVTGASNVIAFNGSEGGGGGIIVSSGVGNAINGNSIFSNQGLGIDLGFDGVTANDAGDGDTGPNNFQNYPVLISAVSQTAGTTVTGTLNSTPNTRFRVELFSNATCDSLGNGEGEVYLTAIDAVTDANGAASFTTTLPPVPFGRVITATATDPNNNTSEFSRCVAVSQCPTFPAGFVPFAEVYSITPPDSRGDRLLIGRMTLDAFSRVNALPLPAFVNEQFCTEIELSPGLFAIAYVPTARERVGDFSAFGGALIDPLTGQSFPGNIIPANRLPNPYAWRIIAFRQATVDLALAKTTATVLPGPGDDVVYSLKVDNLSPNPATGVVLTDTIPANTTFKSLIAVQGWSCSTPQVGGGGTISCSNPLVSGGSSVAFILTVTVNNNVPSDTLINNTAQVVTSTTDSNPNNNTSTVGVRTGAPAPRVIAGAPVEIGPIQALKEPSTDPASNIFVVQNAGNSTLFLTPTALTRVTPDVDKITPPADDRSLFDVRSMTAAGEVPLRFNAVDSISLLPQQTLRFRVVFNPIIPMRAGKTSGLAANQVLPETINSRLILTPRGGTPFGIDLVGRVSTAPKLTHPLDPRRTPQVTLTQSGNNYKVQCWIYDSNLDVETVRYQFLNSNGGAVGDPVDVNVSQALSRANLTKGQIFGLEQNFDGSSNLGVARVRVTVFDRNQSSDSTVSGLLGAVDAAIASVSAASFTEFGLSSESIVAGFGLGMAGSTQFAEGDHLPTSLAGTSLLIRDGAGIERLAPLFYVSPAQINYQLPAGLSPGTATVTVTGGDKVMAIGAVRIANTWPGIFTANGTGDGVAAAVVLRVKSDGSSNYEPVARFDAGQNKYVTAPIDLGSPSDQVYLIMFGTGLRNRSSTEAVKARIGGIDVPVSYAGPQGDYAGLDQVNIPLVRALSGRGEVNVELSADGYPANIVQVSLGGNPGAQAKAATIPMKTSIAPRTEDAFSSREVIVMPPVKLSRY